MSPSADLLTLAETSTYLKTTKWTIYNLLRHRGQADGLPFLKIGRRLYFQKSALELWIQARVQR